jgi:hypothetical protein
MIIQEIQRKEFKKPFQDKSISRRENSVDNHNPLDIDPT